MELSPTLNVANFGWSDRVTVERCLSNINEEERNKLTKLISEILERNFERFFDNNVYELYKKYPKPFRTNNMIRISSKTLGITEDYYYTEDPSNTECVKTDGTISFSICSYPHSDYGSLILTKEHLNKFDTKDLEQLKALFSRILHLMYERDVEVSKFENAKYSIRTIGRLYRVNQKWYEMLVRKSYPEEADVVPEPPADEEETKKRVIHKLSDDSKGKLNDLKGLIDL